MRFTRGSPEKEGYITNNKNQAFKSTVTDQQKWSKMVGPSTSNFVFAVPLTKGLKEPAF